MKFRIEYIKYNNHEIIPAFAKILNRNLTTYAVEVVNVDGTAFSPFVHVLCNATADGTIIIDSKINSVFDYLYDAYAEVRENILRKYGRASEFDSENLILILIKDILKQDKFSSLNVVMHIPLCSLLGDLSYLNLRELEFATNSLTQDKYPWGLSKNISK